SAGWARAASSPALSLIQAGDLCDATLCSMKLESWLRSTQIMSVLLDRFSVGMDNSGSGGLVAFGCPVRPADNGHSGFRAEDLLALLVDQGSFAADLEV